MSTKRYKLLKDLPDAKAGAILCETENGKDYFLYENRGDGFKWCGSHSKKYVENNPEWFSLIEGEEKKEFVWTEQLAKDFAAFVITESGLINTEDAMQKFKSSHQSIKEEQPSERPPLGIMPEWIWKEQRLEDIRQAMTRFNDHHKGKKHCPQEWLDEKHELEKWIADKKFSGVKIGMDYFDEHGKFAGANISKKANEERLRWSDRKKEKAAFDWEIVLWWDGKNHEKAHEYEFGDKSCENVGCRIYAVKRLSDGEIFAIGHEVDAPEFSVSGTIISFKKESYGMIALLRPVLDRRGRINTCNLYNLQKKIPAQPPPTKERTEVTFLSEFARFGKSYHYEFWATKEIPKNKFDSLKKAIESVLNEPK